MSKKKDGAPELEKVYKQTITFKCPVRGMVVQEIEVKKFKGPQVQEDRPVDSAIAELLAAEITELEEAGFHEDKGN